MAQERLRITLDAVDKTSRAFRSITGSLDRLRARVFSLQSAFAAIGVGLVARSFLNVGREVETLENRFKFLFGSVKEGQKAFDTLVDFASKVPFTLQEIAQASGNLAVISKDANELSKNLKIVGNVAAVTGLDFRIVGEQLQRSFSSGIASAEIFRERGVRALLGFKSGATVSVEETIKAFENAFGENGRFANATKVLATTFDGTLSQITDKIFKFQLTTNRANFFGFIKSALATVNEILDENADKLEEFAVKTGNALIKATKGILLGGALIIDALAPVFKFVFVGIKSLFDVLSGLPSGVREIGVIGFLLLGAKGKLLALFIATIFDKIRAVIGSITQGLANFYGTIANILDSLGLLSDEQVGAARKAVDDLTKAANRLKTPFKDLPKEIEKSDDSFSKVYKGIENFYKRAEETRQRAIQELEEINKLIEEGAEGAKKQKDTFVGIELSLKKISEEFLEQANKQFKSINETIAKGVLTGIKSISKGIAESIVLGKKLSDVFKNIAQRILVNVIAKLIEERLIKIANLILDKAKTAELSKQLTLMKTMSILSRASGITGFIGKIMGTTTSTGIDTTVISPFAEGGTFKAGQPMMVGERGREMIIPETSGRVIKNEDLGMMGGANITFNVNAVDVRGVRELLIENRSTITNLINQALNQQGRKALV